MCFEAVYSNLKFRDNIMGGWLESNLQWRNVAKVGIITKPNWQSTMKIDKKKKKKLLLAITAKDFENAQGVDNE